MDEKTEELRDIFREVSEKDTVTEGQTPERGTLAESDDETIQTRCQEVINQVRERFSFETDFADDQRIQVVRAYFRGESDSEIAESLDVSEQTIRNCRLDVHLFRDSDTEAPVEWEKLRGALREIDDDANVSARFDIDEENVRWYRRVLRAREEARRVSHRYVSAFRDIIPEADLTDRLTEGATEDGLEEAAEDIETDVSF